MNRIFVLLILGACGISAWCLQRHGFRASDSTGMSPISLLRGNWQAPSPLGATRGRPAPQPPCTPPQETEPPKDNSLAALPPDDQRSLSSVLNAARRAVQALTKNQAELPQNKGVHHFAAHPSQELTARFLEGAVRIESGRGGTWAGTLRARLGDTFLLTPPSVESSGGHRVTYAHADGLTEWYDNRAEGIEHAFGVAERPVFLEAGEPLGVTLAVAGLVVRPAGAGGETQELDLADPVTRAAKLRYGGVKAWDATGRDLAAHYDVKPDRIRIVVADAGAVYPVTIDPLITSLEAQIGPEVTGDGAASDFFGFKVALDGNTALIGVPNDDAPEGEDTGCAYVFTREGTTWTLQKQLVADVAGPGDAFGASVALSGDTAVVGAPGDDTLSAGRNAGSAFVFLRAPTGWIQLAKLLANDARQDDQFGNAVAVSGDTAVVGAVYDDTAAGINAGSAYVFTRVGTWGQRAKLESDAGSAHDFFGRSVALSGETILVSAYLQVSTGASTPGKVHVFVRNGASWDPQGQLVAGDVFGQAGFGAALALQGDTALVGAAGYSEFSGARWVGKAFVFVRIGSVWTQQGKLLAPDVNGSSWYDSFGESVALSGDTAMVGAARHDTAAGDSAGRVYLFERQGMEWKENGILPADFVDEGDIFGAAVAMSGDTALIGAYGDDGPGGVASGSAHVFVRSGTAWSVQAHLNAGDGARGDHFGMAVALNGETALIGAPYDDTPDAVDAGSAYVLKRTGTTWSQQAKLQPAGSPYDNFGSSVALHGDTALVGSPHLDTPELGNTGGAFVFVRTGAAWSQQAKLLASDGEQDDAFGFSLAVNGDVALIGAPNNKIPGRVHQGSAYEFRRSGTAWRQKSRLVPNDGAAGESAGQLFGTSVALMENLALIGARGDLGVAGSAYVFANTGTTFIQEAKIQPADGHPNDLFGRSVALSGDRALIGSHSGAQDIGSMGTARVFLRGSPAWSHQATLFPDAGVGDDNFGRSVALSGETAVVGATLDANPSSAAGSAYVFASKGGVWRRQATLRPDGERRKAVLGCTVAVEGDTALIGVFEDTPPNPTIGEAIYERGGAYVYRLAYHPDPPTDGTMTLSPTPRVDASADLTVTFDGWTGAALPLTYEVLIDGVVASPYGPSFARTVTAPSVPGPHTLMGRIRDAENRVSEISQTLVVNTALEAWRNRHFGTTDSSGPAEDSADPDADGIANLLEWACGLDPTVPGPLPTQLTRTGEWLEFRYTRSLQAVNAGGAFVVQWSDTLANGAWHTAGVTEEALPSEGDTQHIKATLPAGNQGHRHVRLHFTAESR